MSVLYDDVTRGSEVLIGPDKPDFGATVLSAMLTLLDAPNLNARGSVWLPPCSQPLVSNRVRARLTTPVLIGEGERRRIVWMVGLGLLMDKIIFDNI